MKSWQNFRLAALNVQLQQMNEDLLNMNNIICYLLNQRFEIKEDVQKIAEEVGVSVHDIYD